MRGDDTAALSRVALRAAASRAAAPTAVMGAPVVASEPSLSSLPVRDARSPVRDRVVLLLMSSLSSLSDVCIGGRVASRLSRGACFLVCTRT